MRVVVTNAVLNNTGDAAIYQALRQSLIDEGVCGANEIHVLDANAALSRELYPHWNVHQQPLFEVPSNQRWRRLVERFLRWAICILFIICPTVRVRALACKRIVTRSEFLQSILKLQEADVVISSGGTYLVDHYNFMGRVLELRLAGSMKKPVFLWTQSMGPFNSASSRRSIKMLRNTVTGVYFRDEKSKKAWEKVLPLPAFNGVVPDVVFALINNHHEGNHGVKDPASILVSVRHWRTTLAGKPLEFERYKDAMRSSATALAEKGHRINALSTCQGTPGYGIDDSLVAIDIFRGVIPNVDDSHHTPDQILELLKDADFVVATRMHMAILALVAGTPVVAVAYEFKTKELFESLGLHENVVAMEHISKDWVVDSFHRYVESSEGMTLSTDQRRLLRVQATLPAREVSQFARGGA